MGLGKIIFGLVLLIVGGYLGYTLAFSSVEDSVFGILGLSSTVFWIVVIVFILVGIALMRSRDRTK